ncbi:methylated-DNA--protein-cysteine methyltransferase [Salinicola rhizosphaerae]|uniref:Methylated-DNA--protein-cysteine methyltransferase n=1 Tax=Salinicola rhizosphaerae TaxID=1443141 RepID=A0ABQ3DQ43_9GAMM|nr:methylated-DNA--protein-cysteine methyltransferase [Salinicola rhizosphaerae]
MTMATQVQTYVPPSDVALGPMVIGASEKGLIWLGFMSDDTPPGVAAGAEPGPYTRRCADQLDDYFAGQRETFDLTLTPDGTPFQQRVWQALADIPYGETRSYRDIATAIGAPNAVRAVGAANGRNPLALIVPCHRVIGSNGTLTGYAGGMARKAWLLEHESRHSMTPEFALRG